MDPILERYHELENKILAYTPNLDKEKLFDAFTYADSAHSSQLRKDGTPYITHPLAVAELCADLLKMENPTVAPYAKKGEALLRVTAKADNADDAE